MGTMAPLKLFFLLLLGLLALLLVRGLWGAARFRRRFDDSSEEAAERLRQHLEGPTRPSRAAPALEVMSEEFSRDEIRRIERELLRTLGAGVASSREWEEAIRFLTTYSFQDIVHEQVFHTLRELRLSPVQQIREQLAARMTQKGFPDVDFESFLVPQQAGSHSPEELIEQLRSATARRKGAPAVS